MLWVFAFMAGRSWQDSGSAAEKLVSAVSYLRFRGGRSPVNPVAGQTVAIPVEQSAPGRSNLILALIGEFLHTCPVCSCSRASMVHAPVRDRESDDVRLRRE